MRARPRGSRAARRARRRRPAPRRRGRREGRWSRGPEPSRPTARKRRRTRAAAARRTRALPVKTEHPARGGRVRPFVDQARRRIAAKLGDQPVEALGVVDVVPGRQHSGRDRVPLGLFERAAQDVRRAPWDVGENLRGPPLQSHQRIAAVERRNEDDMMARLPERRYGFHEQGRGKGRAVAVHQNRRFRDRVR